MADLLGATNPVPGLDNAAANRGAPISPNDRQLQNIPEPTRVSRADGRAERQGASDAAKAPVLRYDSNFQTFLQRLREQPDILQAMMRLLGQSTVVSSGITEGLTTEMSQFLAMLRMDEGQLLRFLTNQLQSGNRFGGPLFALLRQAYAQSQSPDMQKDILQFLKAYSDYSSMGHIEKNLLRHANRMARSVPASWGGTLVEIAGQLENSLAAGDRAGALKLIQGRLIPYISQYVGRTHDLGTARGLLTMLALDVARFENGSQENLLRLFHQLTGYRVLQEKLGGLDDSALLALLEKGQFQKAAQADQFADQLAAAAARALRGEGGAEAQSTFRELVSALLINESVYMPVNHILIPLEWDGRMLFSELWVDPDADSGDGPTGDNDKERTLRFLFKMDIEGLGLFDIVLTCQEQRVGLQVRCPERVASFAGTMEQALGHILKENGLEPVQVQVGKMERPLTLSEVFPKLFEGKNGINVKV